MEKLRYWLGTGGKIEYLKNYLHSVEAYLEKAEKDFENWANEEAAKLPPSERDDFQESLSEVYWQYSEFLPRILRNSFLVTLHSVLESELARICESLRRKKAISKSWDEVKGKGSTLEKLKTYISEECGLDFPKGQSWKEIKKYKDIRNCIVHYAGDVRALGKKKEKKKKNLRHYCSKQPGISIDKDENLVLSKDFCLQVVSTLQEFFEELYDSYEGKQAP